MCIVYTFPGPSSTTYLCPPTTARASMQRSRPSTLWLSSSRSCNEHTWGTFQSTIQPRVYHSPCHARAGNAFTLGMPAMAMRLAHSRTSSSTVSLTSPRVLCICTTRVRTIRAHVMMLFDTRLRRLLSRVHALLVWLSQSLRSLMDVMRAVFTSSCSRNHSKEPVSPIVK